jgi:tetratricopeptide (TPR) repeat protein
MALTTVAATIQPDETLAKLAPSRPERFQASDFIASGLVFLITLCVYIATLAPNVTLEDSGELITAAAKFGVGHPPGYPLWTMSGFLLAHLLPFGNLAWRINLLCALFGAVSNAVLTLLACHSGRWLLQRWTAPEIQLQVRPYVFYIGLLVGLVIGFSDVMWSQAVISAVHGTLNALFVNLTLLFFYLWMLEPRKTHRFVLAVFVFALGLTNHHTLVQIIPAFLLAAALEHITPALYRKPASAPQGLFFTVLFAVNLFSLSILVYISWLSGDNELQTISQAMAWMIFISTAAISFFYLKEFRLNLFLLGVATVLAIFAYGYFLLDPGENDALRFLPSTAPHWWLIGSFEHPGWLQGLVANTQAGQPPMPRQVDPRYAYTMLGVAALAIGLLYSSQLNRRLIIGVFVAGWLGLVPYSYERIASATHPPMNWGFASLRSGFYYEVSREQYPKSLPTLIKTTFGKAIRVVPADAQLDATIGLPDYWGRLVKTFYYYGDNLTKNFTAPLIFLILAVLIYLRRCDWPQVNWFLFLGASFFLLGFMLLIIAPQEGFDFERNLQYKVFHLQSHCIFVLLMGYGALALMTYFHELMPEIPAQFGVTAFGVPALFLSLLPLWSNFDGCSQAGHWFGYHYGADMMRPMDRNAVYFGGSDPGRFVPTYMAFVESQQDDRWKADWSVYPKETAARGSAFDRRDVTVITQNALCDTYYASYIRDQYDPRFQPKTWTPFERWLGRDQAYPAVPVTCVSNDELAACWEEYQHWPEVETRLQAGGPIIRSGSNDVFDINGIVAQKIFEKNKKNHTFYVEQSVPIQWMYPYLMPSGLIFKLNPEPLSFADFIKHGGVEEDRKFWDAYSQRLLSDPRFRIDSDAILTFGKLAFWHADLYRWRHMDKEQEYWLRMAVALCPQLQDAVNSLAHLLMDQRRFDEALAIVRQARLDDPRNESYGQMLEMLNDAKTFGQREDELRTQLASSPYDVNLNLSLAALFQDEGKLDELNERMRMIAGLTNWDHDGMAGIVQYYVDQVHNPNAAIAFLEARAQIDPKAGELIYSLAALEASVGRKDDALHYLAQAVGVGGTNAMYSAKIDPRFAPMQDDPRFQQIINPAPATNAPALHPPATNQPAHVLHKPAKT